MPGTTDPAPAPESRLPGQSMHVRGKARFGVALGVVLISGMVVALVADRVVRGFALHHHPMTPQLTLAAAMGGLFTGGLVMLVMLFVAIPWANRGS